MKDLQSNIFKTALCFEGGSMRAAYTSAVVVKLLEEGVYFDNVYGVSAGTSNLVNYLSRDAARAKASFTSFMADPQLGGVSTFLQHKGMFNARYIYQEACLPGNPLVFDFDTFMANPANFCIPTVDRATGQPMYLSREDIKVLNDLMLAVRASSTMPLLMPPPKINGKYCYDGAFAPGGGLPLQKIVDDGFERIVVIRTRKEGFRRSDTNSWAKLLFWRFPEMRDLVLQRCERYNESCDLLEQWQKDGRAYVFYAEDISLTGQERDVEILEENYNRGYAQIEREWDSLLRYIEQAE